MEVKVSEEYRSLLDHPGWRSLQEHLLVRAGEIRLRILRRTPASVDEVIKYQAILQEVARMLEIVYKSANTVPDDRIRHLLEESGLK